MTVPITPSVTSGATSQAQVQREEAAARLLLELLTQGDSEWLRHAACRDADPELFHPLSARDGDTINAALAYCDSCPVVRECGRMRGPATGVWGGRYYAAP